MLLGAQRLGAWLLLLVVVAAVELPATLDSGSDVVIMLDRGTGAEQQEGAGLFQPKRPVGDKVHHRSNGLGYVKQPGTAMPAVTLSAAKALKAPAPKNSPIDQAVKSALAAHGSAAQITKQVKKAVAGAVAQSQRQQHVRDEIKAAVETAVKATKGHPDKAAVQHAVQAAVSSTLKARGVGTLSQTGQASVNGLEKRVAVSRLDAHHDAVLVEHLEKELASMKSATSPGQDATTWDTVSERLKEIHAPLVAEEGVEAKTAAAALQDVKTAKSPAAKKFESEVAKDHKKDVQVAKQMDLMAITSERVVQDVEKQIRDPAAGGVELGEGQEMDNRVDPLSDLSDAQKALAKEMKDVEQSSLAAEAAKYAEKLDVRTKKVAVAPTKPASSKATVKKSTAKPAAATKCGGSTPCPETPKSADAKAPKPAKPTAAKAKSHAKKEILQALGVPAAAKLATSAAAKVATPAAAKVSIDMPEVKASLSKSFGQMEKMAKQISKSDDQEMKDYHATISIDAFVLHSLQNCV